VIVLWVSPTVIVFISEGAAGAVRFFGGMRFLFSRSGG
jgi:hypothetical protein